MDIPVALFRRQPLAVGFSFIKVLPVVNQLRPQSFHRRRLQRIRIHRRQRNIRPRPENLRRPGDGLPVIPRRRRYHPPTPLLSAQVRQQVNPAPRLERPQRQVILMLQINLRIQQLAQPRRIVQRRTRQVRRNRLPRLINIP